MEAKKQTLELDLRARPFWLFVGWMLVFSVIFLSLAPISIQTGVEQGDKALHGFAYSALMLWFASLYGRLGRRWMLAAAFGCKLGTDHVFREPCD